MTEPRIPLDPNGYKVDGQTIHTRYADHGNGNRTRTVKGVETLLDGRKPKLCSNCFPSPRYAEDSKPKAGQRRRNKAPSPSKRTTPPSDSEEWEHHGV